MKNRCILHGRVFVMVLFILVQSVVYSLNVSLNRLITSVGEERAVFVYYRLLVFLLFLFEGVSLPLGAWERLCYLIVALAWTCHIL